MSCPHQSLFLTIYHSTRSNHSPPLSPVTRSFSYNPTPPYEITPSLPRALSQPSPTHPFLNNPLAFPPTLPLFPHLFLCHPIPSHIIPPLPLVSPHPLPHPPSPSPFTISLTLTLSPPSHFTPLPSQPTSAPPPLPLPIYKLCLNSLSVWTCGCEA
jgi:hypothetical protein